MVELFDGRVAGRVYWFVPGLVVFEFGRVVVLGRVRLLLGRVVVFGRVTLLFGLVVFPGLVRELSGRVVGLVTLLLGRVVFPGRVNELSGLVVVEPGRVPFGLVFILGCVVLPGLELPDGRIVLEFGRLPGLRPSGRFVLFPGRNPLPGLTPATPPPTEPGR